MVSKFIVPGMLALGLLAACAGAPREERSVPELLTELGYRLGADNQRIPSYRVNGWNRLNDSNVVVRTGVQGRYLVELNTDCMGLRDAFSIGFTTPGSLSRIDRFEDIVVRTPGLGVQRCPIRNIYRLLPLDS